MEIKPRVGSVGSDFEPATALETASILTAAHSRYGWLGSLDVVRKIVQSHPGDFSDEIKEFGFDEQLKPLPLDCASISGHGVRQCRFENMNDYNGLQAFGADLATQFIGRTLCALCHEIEPRTARDIFLNWILAILVDRTSDLYHALSICLLDDECITKITNEGHARGLNEIFCQVAQDIRPPRNNSGWSWDFLAVDHERNECHTAVGMLRWLMSGATETYYTESLLAMRLATYLKAIGFPVPTMIYRTGGGSSGDSQLKALIFLHRSEEDSLGSLDDWTGCDSMEIMSKDLKAYQPFHHYTYRSVGTLLFNSLGHSVDLDPDILQQQFKSIYAYIKSHTKIKYTRGSSCLEVNVHLVRRGSPENYQLAARKLAKMHFPRRSSLFAPCYSQIATIDLLRTLKDGRNATHPFEYLKEEVGRFRAITAAIVIAVLGNVSDKDFKKIRHISSLDLRSSDWLHTMCPLVDELCSTGIGYSKLVRALATIHCAADMVVTSKDWEGLPIVDPIVEEPAHGIIAWRHGSLSVIPNLLVQMSTSKSSLLIRLIDKFWADVVTDEYGTAVTSCIPDQRAYYGYYNRDEVMEERYGTTFDLPYPEPPDVGIEINIERLRLEGRPILGFIGRANGKAIGCIGLFDILRQLIYIGSLEPKIPCPGHVDNAKELAEHGMVIARTSVWSNLDGKAAPLSTKWYTYIPAQEHEHWALYLAAFLCHFKVKIIRGCVRCVDWDQVHHADKPLFIGLGRDNGYEDDWEYL